MTLINEDIKKLLQENERQKQYLIIQCRKGDRQAFTQFIQEYEDSIFSHVSSLVGNDNDACDITCDIFVEAYKAFPELPEETSIEVWLFKIAERQILNKAKGLVDMFAPFRKTGKEEREPSRQDLAETDNLLLAYLDGELSKLDAERVKQRLKEDAAYHKEFEQLQRTDDLLRFSSDRIAPTDLRISINAKLDEKTFWEKISDTVDGVNIKTRIPHLTLPLYQGIRGPEGQEIFNLEIRDGLKQFLLANLYANHGLHDIALEQLENQLVIEKDPEIRRLLEYASQKIEAIKEEDTPEPDPCYEIRQQAETKYDKAEFYQKHGEDERAIRIFLEALQLYRQIKSIEGQVIVRHQLALLYKDTGHNEEALKHAQEFLKLYQELKIVRKFDQIQELLRELE